MVTTGLVFRPQAPPEQLRDAVRAVDDAGVAELWLWEDCFLEGGLTTAAMALAWTSESSRLRVGLGLMPVPLRNPALAAMEVATLARTFPGRFVPTFGHGVLDWMRQVGGGVESPMTLLRESVTAVRSLLHGETVSTSGRYVSLDAVGLDWPPAEPPVVMVGARGPKTVALAGEVGDGVLLDAEAAGPDEVRRARSTVGPDARVVVYAEVTPDDAVGQVHERIDELAEAGADSVVLQGPGDRPDPVPLLRFLER